MAVRFKQLLWGTALAGTLSLSPNTFAMQDSAAQTPPAASKAPMTKPSDQEIADAKSKGMVWANKSSKSYHKAESKYFGKSKHSEFMTEEDAQKAGFHEAKEPMKKSTAPTDNK